MFSIKCNCKIKQCPVFSTCCQLPTEFFLGDNGLVDLLFIGQGGGVKERQLGRPFIGPSGQRLRKLIIIARKRLGFTFGVAFSNSIRDNPIKNRVPTKEEISYCQKHIFRDVKYLQKNGPLLNGLQVLIPLGADSKKFLLPANKTALSKDRGTIYTIDHSVVGKIKIMPTFHPSYLIRNGSLREDKINPLDELVIQDIIEAVRACY